jgi:hypothetical protein
MYYAMVFFCLAAGDCVVATDNYSPHHTQEQCDTRLADMQKQILIVAPFAEIEGAICKREGSST